MKSFKRIACVVCLLLVVLPDGGVAQESLAPAFEHCMPARSLSSFDPSVRVTASAQCSEATGAIALEGTREAGIAPIDAPHIAGVSAEATFLTWETLSQPVGPRTYTVTLEVDEAMMSDASPPMAPNLDGIQLRVDVGHSACSECGTGSQTTIVGVTLGQLWGNVPFVGQEPRFSRRNETISLSVILEPHGDALPEGRVNIRVGVVGYSQYSPGPARFSLSGRLTSVTATDGRVYSSAT